MELNRDSTIKAAFLHLFSVHIPTLKVCIFEYSQNQREKPQNEILFKSKHISIEKRKAVETPCARREDYNLILYDGRISEDLFKYCIQPLYWTNEHPVLEIKYGY